MIIDRTAQRITRCKRLRFASSKSGFSELLLHRIRYMKSPIIINWSYKLRDKGGTYGL